MRNLVLLMEPSREAQEISSKGGNMFLNRFSIDEDAAFELLGVYYLTKWPLPYRTSRNEKGKGSFSLQLMVSV